MAEIPPASLIIKPLAGRNKEKAVNNIGTGSQLGVLFFNRGRRQQSRLQEFHGKTPTL
jgi:hypothetical protein